MCVVFAHPQKKINQQKNDFSGKALISLGGIMTLGQSDYSNGKIGFGATAIAQYFIPTNSPTFFGLRFFFGGQSVRGSDKFKEPTEFITDMYFLGGGLTLGYTFDYEFFPYLYGGISNLWFTPKDINGKKLLSNSSISYPASTIVYDTEVGSHIMLKKNLSLFFGFGFHFVQNDNIDNLNAGRREDFYYSGKLGLSIALFGKKDSDGDGIWDTDDACPSNPEDYDGFQDEDGCPEYDNDGDGITDEKDKCPNDPEDFDGFQDDDGCPDLDNDGDGLPDSLDACPNEAENFNGFEDEDGCPDILDNLHRLLDTDKDGIPNYLDKCPDQAETYNGFQDDDGCPDTIMVNDTLSIKQIVFEGIKLFDWRSSEIKPTAYEELNRAAEFLLNDPFIKWAVESYTDNYGDSDSLRALSQERAAILVRYFISKGLPSFMFKVFGKGSESPIADNNSLEGRIKNNRIVIRIIE